VEHRLVGIAHVVAVVSTGFFLSGWGLWNAAHRVGGVWHVVGS